MSTTNALPKPPVVSAESWAAALQEQEAHEQKMLDAWKAAAASRRRMPMTPVQGNYTFSGPEGEVSFAELFAGKRQLAIYHFMFAPDWSKGCPHCTGYARYHGPGINDELTKRDTRYILTSRAPYEKLAAWAQEKSIVIPWYSAPTEFSEEMGAIVDDFGDIPGISVFFRDEDDRVYRTWRTSGAAVETTMPGTAFLRMTPYGMQEKGEDSPEGWPQPNEPLG